MGDWKQLTLEMEGMLKLRSFPVAYKRLEIAADLDSIRKVKRLDRYFLFCQIPGMVRTRGWTIGVTSEDDMSPRCRRLHGLDEPTGESMEEESRKLSTTWFRSPEEAMIQQGVCSRIPKGEAIVLAPLASNKFEPDVVLVYGNPAQLMMIMCGLQKMEFEQFQFQFSGEGSCSDSLGKCYNTGKPALSIPCFGERKFGEVLDEELVLALPPRLVPKAVEGMQQLSAVGLRMPIPIHGAEHDPTPNLSKAYSGS